MKTIQVNPAEVLVNEQVIGTVTSVTIGGSVEVFGTSVNAWITFMGNGASLVGRNISTSQGCSESGIDWNAVEADILNQIGLVKSAEQNPEPVKA